MPLFSLDGHRPQIHETAWIAPTACLIGDVTVEEHASVWFNAVIRGDSGPIVIRAGANVQDGTVIHGDSGRTEIGPGVTIGHSCMVHGPLTIGRQALIGNGSTVLNGAAIGDGALVGAGSLVTPNTVIPPGVMALGAPARVTGPLSEQARTRVEVNGGLYVQLADRYTEGLVEVEDDRER
jgi:carbonic anhydrase/acetyltransferase-like protein (isoleucine patch superfamily)